MNGVATRKTLVSGAIAVAVIVTLALVAFNGQSLVGFTHAEFEAQVESAIGVHQYSSDLRVRGLRVGEVTGVEAKDESAVVRFRIDPDIDVYADARLALRLKNILGEKYLELEPGTSGGPLEGPIPLSATETSTDLGALVGSASGPLSEFAPEDLADARAAAKSLTAEHAPTLTELLDSARGAAQRVTDDTASGLGAIDDLDTLLATLAANRVNIAAATSNVEALATGLTGFVDARSRDLLQIFVSGIALRAALDARAADIAATGAEVPTAISLARTLVAYLVDNLENGGHPLPIGITNFGSALARDYGVPEDGGGS